MFQNSKKMQRLTNKLNPSQRHREAGFTLIEILVVLAIIGLIVSVVGPRVIGYLSDSKIKAARIQVDSLSAALDLFYLDAGRYPTNTENLPSLVQRPVGLNSWNGPYLKGGVVPKDPWGNAYVYRFPGQHGPYDLYSLGPEGREGANNIANWSK